jgi:hypothetical protein
MLEQLKDGYLPESLHRNVSDFGDGDTLFIPTLGETVLRDYVEDTAVKYDAIDTGQVSLTITEYVQGGTYVTNKLKQDAYKAAALEASIAPNHLRKIKEKWETDLLKAANDGQTVDEPNTFNGFAHRIVADNGTTVGVFGIEEFVYMRLAFDKANVPEMGRIAIVDPVSEAAINKLAGDQGFVNNPKFEGLITSAFAKDHHFLRNIMGWDIWVSNRLHRIAAAETIDGGPGGNNTAAAGFISNVFMCVADDQCKPLMGAMRQMPKTDGEYNKDFQRDEYVTTARWGFGTQRVDTLGIVLSHPTLYK